MPVTIRELLTPTCISLQVEAASDKEIISSIAAPLQAKRGVINFPGLVNDILTREKLSPTCIGNAMAIPHARTDHVKRIVMAAGRSKNPVYFDAEPVQLVFVIGIPRSMPGRYLSLISALGRLAANREILDLLLAASTPKQFFAALPAKI
jgi:mannitol/fructose-specific phosphotransferase system IIA component (Ntr-type)